MYMSSLIPAPEHMAPSELNDIINTLLHLIELKNEKLHLHCHQVANYSVSIAAKMRLPKDEIERIHLAACSMTLVI